MTDVIETADALHASANRLYWHSHESADTLAERLGMSRHALHSSIRPLPAGLDCECGGEMVFFNRKHRADGEAHCPDCGTVASVEAVHDEPAPPPLAVRRGRRISPKRAKVTLRRWMRELSYVPRERAAMIGGAAAAGMVAAMLAGEVLRDLQRW